MLQIGYYDPIAALRLSVRRGAGVAEQGCLLSSYTGKTGVGGSNPPLSAIKFDKSFFYWVNRCAGFDTDFQRLSCCPAQSFFRGKNVPCYQLQDVESVCIERMEWR